MAKRLGNMGGKCLAVAMLLTAVMGGCAQQQTEAKGDYMFWPNAPDAPRVQFLMSISSTGDITGRQSKMDELIYGRETGTDLPFERPFGIRIYSGRLYVCDATAANVSICDMAKKEVRILGQGGNIFAKPIDIAVAPDGLKYVADTGLKSVVVFDENDHQMARIAVPDMHPVAVAVHNAELFVADFKACKIRVFNRLNGKETRTIGTAGGKDGEFGGPIGVAVDKHGNIYVDDFVKCRVQKFTLDGKFVSSLGGLGDLPGKFVRPKHLAVDSDGILYVVDNGFSNIQMFNDKGEMLMFFGALGQHPGSMDSPAGVSVSDADVALFAGYAHPAFEIKRVIAVSNQIGPAKINIYGLGQLKPGKTVNDISGGRRKGVFGFDENPASSQPAPTTLPDEPTTAPRTLPRAVPASGPSTAPVTPP